MRRSVIIFEGPDGTGKSTVAQHLANDLNARFIHTGPPDPGVSAFEQYTNMIDAMCDDVKTQCTVYDRFHIGERCYGPVLRGRDSLSEAGMKVIERELHDFNVLLIMCRPPFRTAFDTWSHRKDHGAELVALEDQYAAIWERYIEMDSKTTLPLTWYNYTAETGDKFVARIKRYMEDRFV